ncbi:MAG: hypothetical protein M1338_00455, partial [Patescibacteria group bacterium]|nr:hypothetical protein [Patescibacteria group bacterium]
KKKKPANGAIGSSLEIDLRDHLQHLQEVIGEEEYKNIIQTQTQFVTDFNSLARCPELTGSCQRLTEQTGYNESAYSRILDGNDELIDLWEMKNISGKLQKHQRLARCFSELSAIKIKDQKKLVVMLDRIYTHPEYSTFKEKFAENIIGTALQRFEKNSDFALFFSTKYFSDYKNLIQLLAQKNGYQLNEINDAQYFVNESNLKIDKGKYYDSIQGSENTKEAHYSSITGYLLEKIQS